MKKYKQNNQIRFAYPQVKLNANVGIFIYDPSCGKDYVLNRFGTLVWENLKNETTIESLYEKINEYDIYESGVIKEDVVIICKYLLNYNLIDLV